MAKKISLIFLFLFFKLSAQDTLTIMHYNILNYGNTTSFCPETKYPLSDKNKYIRIITNYVGPDIISFNEVSPEIHYHDSLLNAIQSDEAISYRLAPVTNLASSNLVNLLFYNENKIGLHSAKVIRHSLRDINLYKLFYRESHSNSFDTVFFNCIVAHLKAGSTKEDEEIRSSMTDAIMDWLEKRGEEQNYFLMGDFNLYSSTEKAYQKLTNNSNINFRFYDPIDQSGKWHDDSSYAGIHTQSTHLNGDCFAGGGLDDRFDFILFNGKIKEEKSRVCYLKNSYKVIGNNGNFFNDSIYFIDDRTLPKEVMEALYGNSDHLPVSLKFIVKKADLQSISEEIKKLNFQVVNPVKDVLKIKLSDMENSCHKIHIRNIFGNLLYSRKSKITEQEFEISIINFPKGVYILTLENEKGFLYYLKFIKA